MLWVNKPYLQMLECFMTKVYPFNDSIFTFSRNEATATMFHCADAVCLGMLFNKVYVLPGAGVFHILHFT